IVIAIVGILASIAYPAYSRYIVRTHRTAAKACMAEVAQFMERYYTTNMSYVDANPVAACESEAGLDQLYDIRVDDIAARAYTVTAEPIGTQATRDAQCGTLTLDEAATRGKSGSADFEYCWSR
ncbi:MAG TPA: type IV pilin protein, partial [Steroidobacteraceae bacterium]